MKTQARFKQEVQVETLSFLKDMLKNMIGYGWIEEITIPVLSFDYKNGERFNATEEVKTVYLLTKEDIYPGQELVDLELSEEDYKAIKSLESLIKYFNENQSSKLAQRAL